jgi:small-conductance mechanosensitive channel
MVDLKYRKSRFGAAAVAAVCATVAIMPARVHHSAPSGFDVFAMALVPAFVAWVIVRNSPARQGFVVFRGVMLAIAFVGIGGLVLHFVSGQTPAWIEEAVESPGFIAWAAVYLCIGLFGAAAALLLQPGDAGRRA